MRKDDELYDLCLSNDLNVSISWQKVTDWTVEIYKGYKTNYKNIFFTQAVKKEEAVKEALEFMKNFNVLEWDRENASSIDPTNPTPFESAEFIYDYLEKYHSGKVSCHEAYVVLASLAAQYNWHIQS